MKKLPKVKLIEIKCKCGSKRGNKFTSGKVVCLVCGTLYKEARKR